MAYTDETARLVEEQRAIVNAAVDATSSAVAAAWAAAWDQLAGEWEAALIAVAELSTDGRWPSPWRVARVAAARAAMDRTVAALRQLSSSLPSTVAVDAPRLVEQVGDLEARIITSQLPPAERGPGMAQLNRARLDRDALDAILERTTQQVESLARPLTRAAQTQMKATLIRGIAVGDNPRTAARVMTQRVEGAFNGGRNRALVIARTEMLDAHRTAARGTDALNADVLAGWQWVATLDRRTCPSCWSKHGTTHPLSEDGPHDHQQGRCVGAPITKSWADLGFDVPEPPSVLQDAQTVFKALPEADQLAIMGRARLDALRSGRAQWGDLSMRRTTRGWRDSYTPTPVRDLTARN